jgi:hypothetical protein
MFMKKKYLVVRRDGTMPQWPSFVLGAQDPASSAALRAYVHAHMEQGKQDDEKLAYLQGILDEADAWDRYREEHGARQPEEVDRREESHDVMTALGGNTSVVVVLKEQSGSDQSAGKRK